MKILRRHASYESGMTLVELIVVMVIIAILMGAGFLGLLSWLATDNVNEAQARVRTALQMAMAEALTHPAALMSTSLDGNWSLQLVTQGTTQELYVCTGSGGGCAGNTNPTAGPVEVHASAIPLNVSITINGSPLTCLAFSPLGQPLLAVTTATPATHSTCVWPAANSSGEWVFQTSVSGGKLGSSSYVF